MVEAKILPNPVENKDLHEVSQSTTAALLRHHEEEWTRVKSHCVDTQEDDQQRGQLPRGSGHNAKRFLPCNRKDIQPILLHNKNLDNRFA